MAKYEYPVRQPREAGSNEGEEGEGLSGPHFSFLSAFQALEAKLGGQALILRIFRRQAPPDDTIKEASWKL